MRRFLQSFIPSFLHSYIPSFRSTGSRNASTDQNIGIRVGNQVRALSQHGTVAPVTIHHRVDFAASMIDGRTVGEVMPNSASAKEISDLWTYIQERLSRIVRDPALLPQIKAQHLAINALLSPGAEPAMEMIEPPPPIETRVYDGPERRSGGERRLLIEPRGLERRVFGRRAGDVPAHGGWK